jgi:hypothetical protein
MTPKANSGQFCVGMSVLERFWVKVNKTETCWLWTASCFHDGYGKFYVDGKTVRAHRTSYELFVGPIPDGLHIDHLCRTPLCVNPAHLEPVTPRENTFRSPLASPPVLLARTHCGYGHEYTPANTYVRPSGARLCRECGRLRAARKRQGRNQPAGPPAAS